jgi:hypothetical protein
LKNFCIPASRIQTIPDIVLHNQLKINNIPNGTPIATLSAPVMNGPEEECPVGLSSAGHPARATANKRP